MNCVACPCACFCRFELGALKLMCQCLFWLNSRTMVFDQIPAGQQAHFQSGTMDVGPTESQLELIAIELGLRRG